MKLQLAKCLTRSLLLLLEHTWRSLPCVDYGVQRLRNRIGYANLTLSLGWSNGRCGVGRRVGVNASTSEVTPREAGRSSTCSTAAACTRRAALVDPRWEPELNATSRREQQPMWRSASACEQHSPLVNSRPARLGASNPAQPWVLAHGEWRQWLRVDETRTEDSRGFCNDIVLTCISEKLIFMCE